MKNRLIISVLLVIISITIYAQGTESVYFVQITDTHLGTDDHNERMGKIVRSINQLPIDISCVVHTGDIFQNNIMNHEVVKEGIKVLEQIKYPVHYVPGNHDILYYEFEENMKQYLTYFKSTDTVVIYKDLALIFIYTEPLRGDKIISNFDPFNALKKYLERHKNLSKIVLHHAPSVKDFYNNKMHKGWDEDVYEKWIALLNYYDVKAVIAGHFHRGELHWLKDVPLYISPSTAGFWGRQASYRIYEYKEGKLSYQTVYIE